MSPMDSKPFTHDPSATAAFQALGAKETLLQDSFGGRGPKAVVIGGGTGASMAIRTLLSLGLDTDAVVAMADDGGSTGILRDQAGATPPGDIRKCLTAMAADPEDPLVKAFKVRFSFAENHTLGNLMLSALEVTSGSFPEAIAICERLLKAKGHVYPSTLSPVSLMAKTSDGRTLEGQAVASHSRTALRKVALSSPETVSAYKPALGALANADLIVLGPGSLFTSIIPNILVPGVVNAIGKSRAKTVFVCSIADMQGETRGLNPAQHLEALHNHGMKGLVDYMLVQDGPPLYDTPEAAMVRYLALTEEDTKAIEATGTRIIARDFTSADNPLWHDPEKLRCALKEVLA